MCVCVCGCLCVCVCVCVCVCLHLTKSWEWPEPSEALREDATLGITALPCIAAIAGVRRKLILDLGEVLPDLGGVVDLGVVARALEGKF